MATLTKSANTGVDMSGWSSPSNVTTDDTSCASAILSGTQNKEMYTTYTSSSIFGTITEVAIRAIGSVKTTQFQTGANAYFSKDGGSTYCVGHGLGGFPESGSGSCSTVAATSFIPCNHTGFGGDLIDTEWNETDNRWKIRATSISDTSTVYVDYVESRVTYTAATVPASPADPTITATAVKQISTSQASPSDGGSALDNVEVQISTSSTFASGNITWIKGSAPVDPQTHDFTSADGVIDGTLYYARARYKNGVGWGAYNASPYNSATSWNVPDAQDLVSATTPEDSMILITRNGSYPNGNGEPVDSWEVWRSTSDGGSYSELVAGLTAITYNDWSVNGGETWFYKAKFTNLVGDSLLSTNSVTATATTPEITKISDTTIQAIGEDSRQVTRTVLVIARASKGVSREVKAVKSRQVSRIVFVIARTSRNISRIVLVIARDSRSTSRIVQRAEKDSRSISRTVFILQEFTKTSDSTIKIIREISRVSNTTIYKLGLLTTKTSDVAIFREEFVTLDKTSDSRIKEINKEITYLSDSRIKNTFEQSPLSDSTIFRSQFGDIQISSDTRIVLEGTIVLPPIFSDSRILVLDNELTKLSDSFIILGQEITTTSDTAIYQSQYGDITKTSDSAIYISQFGDITKLSDSAIFKSGLEITKLNDTRIKRLGGYMYPFQKQEIVSDTRIFFPDNVINKPSFTRIKEMDNELTKLSDALIILKPIINKISDAFIEVLFTVSIPSRTRIKNTAETTTLSDATIFRSQYGDITKLSNTLIYRAPIIDKTSDTTIVVLFEMSGIPSDTYIINEDTQIDIISDTSIFRAGYNTIEKESRSAIKGLNLEMTKLSDSVIRKTFSLSKTSDIAIRRDRPPMVTIFEKSRQL